MESAHPQVRDLLESSKRLARQLLSIGENRCELLMLEVQEERARLLRAILLALGVAAFGLLAGVALICAIMVLLSGTSRVAVLLVLTGLCGVTAFVLHRRLTLLMRDWQNLPATLDQLRKDRTCLESTLQ